MEGPSAATVDDAHGEPNATTLDFPRLKNAPSGLFHFIKVMSAIAEQAIFAGTNFMLTVLLVRWMPIDHVGVYSFCYSLIIVTCMLFEALVSEPIPILGPSRYASRLRCYTGAVVFLHLAISVLASFALLAVGSIFQGRESPLIGETMVGAVIAAPLLFLRPMTQQLCYTHSYNGLFALGGVAYAILAPAFLFVLHIVGALKPSYAIISIGGAMALPCLFIMVVFLRPDLRLAHIGSMIREVLRDHWRYGRWAIIAQTNHWLGGNIFHLVGPSMIGLEATAAVRAIFNMIIPVNLATAATLSAAAPTLAKYHSANERDRYRKTLGLFAGTVLSWTAGYALLFSFFGMQAIHYCYRGAFDKLVSPSLIVWLCVIPVLSVLNAIVELNLRLNGKMKSIAFSKFAWTASTMTIGIGACAAFGLLGVFIGWALSSVILLSRNIWCSRRLSARAADGQVHRD